MKFLVEVMPRAEALDPQGRTILHSLKSLGFGAVADCRVGKAIVLTVDSSDQREALKGVEKMAEKLLFNPLIETYRVRVLE